MSDVDGISKPLPEGIKASKFRTEYMEDTTHCCSLVRALLYVTVTRPEMCYSVNKVCQFMAQQRLYHWKAVMQILRYLKESIDYGLCVQPAVSAHSYCFRAFCCED